MSQITVDDIIQYLVDCLGYSVEADELDTLSINELVGMMSADELAECYQYNNK